MGAYDTHIANTSALNARFHLPLASDIDDDLGNVTPANVGTVTFGGSTTITGTRTGADTDAATALNGTSQGVYVTDSIAATIMESGGWVAGWYRSDSEQTHPGMVFSISEAAEDDVALWLYVTDQTGFNEDKRTVHVQVRSNTGSQLLNEVGLAHCFEHPLGAHIVANLTLVTGTTWRLRVWVNGNLDLDEEFTRSGTFTGCDTVSFGMVRRNGANAFWYDGDVSKCSAGSGSLTDAQVRAMFDAGRGYSDSDYQNVDPGGTVDTTDFAVDEAAEIVVNLTAPCRVMPFYVVPDSGGTDSLGINTTFAPTEAGSGVRALDGGNDREMFGQGFPGKTHMGWAHDLGSYEIPAGKHTLTFNTVARSGTAGTTAKVGAHFSFGEDLPVCGTVNAYSSPTSCKLNGDKYWIDAEVGSDDRYVFRRTSAGVVTARKVSDGLRLNDINHAGGFVLPLGSDLLVGVVGHNDAQIRCSLFTGGDISSAPGTTYNIGDSTSRLSYPQAKVITGTTVGVLIRGTFAGSDPDEHASIFVTFDGTDGTGAAFKYIIDTDDGDKSGKRGYSIGWDTALVSSKRLYGFLLNPRDWSDDRPESLAFVAWNATDDTWHLLNGDEINVSNTGQSVGTGARNSPIVNNTVLGQKVTAAAGSRGVQLAIDSDYSVNTLHAPDADALLLDLTGGIADMKLLTLFTTADQPAGGDFQTTQWRVLTYDGGLTIDTFTPYGGDANTTFATAAMSWKDGVIGGTAQVVICNPTREVGSGIDGETRGPYYGGWGGGDAISWIETDDPFNAGSINTAPIARWDSPGVRTPSNIGIVGGAPNAFAYQMEVSQDLGHATKSQREIGILEVTGDMGQLTGSAVLKLNPSGGFRTRSRNWRVR